MLTLSSHEYYGIQFSSKYNHEADYAAKQQAN